MFSHAMTGSSSFAQSQVQWAPYSWLVMSSMVGLVEVAFGSGLWRIILLMEVVTVSTYVRPIASSVTMRLELMLEIPSIITSPINRVPTDAS